MIEHQGTVLSVTEHGIFVEILTRSACAGCKAKTFCAMSEQKEKQVLLTPEPGTTWSVGEEILVTLRSSLGYKAVFLMYVLPLLFLLVVLFTLPHFHVSELFTGLAALVAPFLCYFVVWIFRDRIEKEYIFAAKKLNPV